MIKQHRTFEDIPDQVVLWQYMSLTKFLILIKGKKLHLHRIDDYPDKDEGVLSVLDKNSLALYKDTDEWKKYLEDDRKRTFISCWIKYPIEQSLMWYAYGRDGVAIRTTAGAIKRALDCDKTHCLRMIAVKYLDKDNFPVHMPGKGINFYNFYTTKRKFFELENEVRLIFHDNVRAYADKKGLDVDVDLDLLIDEIKISSSLPNYVCDLIQREVKDAGLKITPIISEI